MKNLNEINIIRAIMCLSIVVTHSISNYLRNVEVDQAAYDQYILWLRFALLCSTPIFILLSETLLSKNYPNGLKNGFFLKRIKYILLPYILIGLIVSYRGSDKDFSSFIEVAFQKVVLGQWYGFFVIVIFQFYILHWLIGKYLARVNPLGPILISFAISFAHVYCFVHVNFYQNLILTDYPLWYKTHIFMWLFYFIVAFYIGQYYEQLITFLTDKIWVPVLMTLISFGIIMYNYLEMDYTRISSERYDMLLYSVSMFFLLVALIRKFNYDNQTLVMISNFSFFIYLTHMVFLPYFAKLSMTFGDNFFAYVAIMAFLTISSCIGVAFLLYQSGLTRHFTGKIKYLEPAASNKASFDKRSQNVNYEQ
ncbi:acyltransferase family protein [Planococcus sp. CPCC 101016]|uniref:acyltransferase family protein n=1 Tax=Planococcus sp. CPCC 101016 TaxID=2599617 RepID=UPI0011B4BA7A|nr:acyltransferase family protein [Planococcus sp. CPCC 101016]TWT07162.1 acyltransferase family protein [Planococcus sp. CPCC 101016]